MWGEESIIAFEVEVRADTAKFTNVIVERLHVCYFLFVSVFCVVSKDPCGLN